VTELRDPRRTSEGDRPREGLLLGHQLEPVPEGVVERNAGTDPARSRRRDVEAPDLDATTFEFALRLRQGALVSKGEAGCDDPGPALDKSDATTRSPAPGRLPRSHRHLVGSLVWLGPSAAPEPHRPWVG
jgi:hypothetical protein